LVTGQGVFIRDRANRTIPGSFLVEDNSSLGSRVDILAPGEFILTTVAGSGYRERTGTSYAAPHVTGVAGMIWSINPNLTGSDVRNIIISSATVELTFPPEVPIRGAGADARRIYPILNAASAVTATIQTLDNIGDNDPDDDEVLLPNLFGRVTHTIEWGASTHTFGVGNVDVRVYDVTTGNMITTITTEIVPEMVMPDDFGSFILALPEGSYSFTFRKDGYELINWPYVITIGDSVVIQEFNLPFGIAAPEIYIDGVLVDYNFEIIPNGSNYSLSVRGIAFALGYSVNWIPENQEALFQRPEGGNIQSLIVGQGFVTTQPSNSTRVLNGASPFLHNDLMYLRDDAIAVVFGITHDSSTIRAGVNGGHLRIIFQTSPN